MTSVRSADKAEGPSPGIPRGFAAVLGAITPERICRRDPLGRLVLRRWVRGAWPVFAAGVIINGLLIVGAGFVISRIYACGPPRNQFVCIGDPRILVPDVLGNIISFRRAVGFAWDKVGMVAAYAAAVPMLLLSGAWATHRAMVRAKQQSLEPLREQIRALLAESDPVRIRQSAGLLEELWRRYEIKAREFRVWPFRAGAVSGFGLGALGSPFLSWTIPFAIDRYLLPR
jgi:hypothetical protein